MDRIDPDALRRARLNAGLSYADLAARTRAAGEPVSEAMLRNLEGRRPWPRKLKAIADALGVRVTDLLEAREPAA
jgi:transcriptional regulator with XRE-family HTH domain